MHFTRKPYGCDWGTAPIGSKHCSYEPTVSAYNAQGELIAGKTPDKGTWEAASSVIGVVDTSDPAVKRIIKRDLKVKRVEIDWVKVAD